MRQVISFLMIAIALSGCGIKRPLVLPDHDKKEQTQEKTAPQAPAADAVSPAGTPADRLNPATTK